MRKCPIKVRKFYISSNSSSVNSLIAAENSVDFRLRHNVHREVSLEVIFVKIVLYRYFLPYIGAVSAEYLVR